MDKLREEERTDVNQKDVWRSEPFSARAPPKRAPSKTCSIAVIYTRAISVHSIRISPITKFVSVLKYAFAVHVMAHFCQILSFDVLQPDSRLKYDFRYYDCKTPLCPAPAQSEPLADGTYSELILTHDHAPCCQPDDEDESIAMHEWCKDKAQSEYLRFDKIWDEAVEK
ncbi:hypothetical protein QAD02_006170 [Eretmocerus hayati]|uniref:Uncharacterized protein n=1 Tax=Eretmocerus hayati TaxID=131215 RepID=A0ACC2N087_9HYME|nr:hypothetical protein QAD02_006170 [Eretmocerus hayati]